LDADHANDSDLHHPSQYDGYERVFREPIGTTATQDYQNLRRILDLAFMPKNPTDYAMFGKAVAIPHQPGRDDATSNEIARLDWINDWPH
jgi:hypothetical protein